MLVGKVAELLKGAGRVLDGTLGGGGHSAALLEAGVKSVVGLDRDPDAVAASLERLGDYVRAKRFFAFESNYADIASVPDLLSVRFNGILLDLGVSSHQIDADARGFTFRPGVRLDMRMGRDVPRDAAALLNDEDEPTLAKIFKDYGDEARGARLAREVARRRETRPFESSNDFVGAIRAVLGPRSGPADLPGCFRPCASR